MLSKITTIGFLGLLTVVPVQVHAATAAERQEAAQLAIQNNGSYIAFNGERKISARVVSRAGQCQSVLVEYTLDRFAPAKYQRTESETVTICPDGISTDSDGLPMLEYPRFLQQEIDAAVQQAWSSDQGVVQNGRYKIVALRQRGTMLVSIFENDSVVYSFSSRGR